MPTKPYTPPLSRFLICALFHEAKARRIPMTRLANEIVERGLKESAGWQLAQEQMGREGAEQNQTTPTA